MHAASVRNDEGFSFFIVCRILTYAEHGLGSVDNGLFEAKKERIEEKFVLCEANSKLFNENKKQFLPIILFLQPENPLSTDSINNFHSFQH